MLPLIVPSSVSIALLIIATHAFPSSIIPGTGVCFFQNTTYLPTRLPEKRARKGTQHRASSRQSPTHSSGDRARSHFKPPTARRSSANTSAKESRALMSRNNALPANTRQCNRREIQPRSHIEHAPRLSTNIVGRRVRRVHATRHCPSSGNPQMRSPEKPNAFFDSGCRSSGMVPADAANGKIERLPNRGTFPQLTSADMVPKRPSTFKRLDIILLLTLADAGGGNGRVEHVHPIACFALTKSAEAYQRLPEFDPLRKLTGFFRSLLGLGFILESRRSACLLVVPHPLRRPQLQQFARSRKTAPGHASTAHSPCNLLAQLHISTEFVNLLGTYQYRPTLQPSKPFTRCCGLSTRILSRLYPLNHISTRISSRRLNTANVYLAGCRTPSTPLGCCHVLIILLISYQVLIALIARCRASIHLPCVSNILLARCCASNRFLCPAGVLRIRCLASPIQRTTALLRAKRCHRKLLGALRPLAAAGRSV